MVKTLFYSRWQQWSEPFEASVGASGLEQNHSEPVQNMTTLFPARASGLSTNKHVAQVCAHLALRFHMQWKTA